MKAGEPMTLKAVVVDDGMPKRRGTGLAGAAVTNKGSRRSQRRESGAREPRDAAAGPGHRGQERGPPRDVVRLPRTGQGNVFSPTR